MSYITEFVERALERLKDIFPSGSPPLILNLIRRNKNYVLKCSRCAFNWIEIRVLTDNERFVSFCTFANQLIGALALPARYIFGLYIFARKLAQKEETRAAERL